VHHLHETTERRKPGDAVVLEVWRGGSTLTLVVVLEEYR
jgi:hypothetical protein